MIEQAIETQSVIDESNDVQALELIVENSLAGYFETGRALKEIRERKLHPGNFKDYVKSRFDMRYHDACRMVRAAEVARNLKDAELQIPRNEAQAHAMHGLEPKQQVRVWKKALAEFARPTAKQVEQLIKKMKLKPTKSEAAISPEAGESERGVIPITEVSNRQDAQPTKQPILLASLDRVVGELREIETEVASVDSFEGVEARLAEVERLLNAIRSKVTVAA